MKELDVDGSKMQFKIRKEFRDAQDRVNLRTSFFSFLLGETPVDECSYFSFSL
jgi:hypothetical protein